MDNSHQYHSNGHVTDPGLQIIRHPKFVVSWFDIRVFYVRISNFTVDDSTPECLTLSHIPVGPDTVLEVNGARCSMNSQGISSTLRRDRVDRKSEEATFVSTDSVRLTDSVRFEVFDKGDLVISGVLESSSSNGCVGGGESYNNGAARRWSMSCESVISAGSGFLKGKQIVGPDSSSSSPTIEVYVAGCFSGTPIILTKTLQINPRKKHRKGMLNSIPESEATSLVRDPKIKKTLLGSRKRIVAEYKNYKPESEEEYDSLYWRQTEYVEGEDGELSWFNAGVRVGVGIGLGICLGVGIGVGLLVRTYQTTTRTFKRRLI
ncbi:hypothetical protein MIMGU_mgv1a010261mg [Erythranthe guttata]|uniref:Erythronate-4-phosphate dehydrogenase family protein n=1 Tax=Erythranthe guttata TaxID=4155 RepID=A0A022S1N4_ERYGU|nr:hypothetical protein MIMGU_mgv1a010261mg [Erythranthe guttata]